MSKISPDDLDRIAQQVKNVMHLRKGVGRARILVHMGTCGIAAGARAVMSAIMKELEERKLEGVMLSASSCAGLCSREPMVTVEIKDHPPVKYVDVTPEKVKEIVEKHVIGGTVVSEYALSAGSERVL